MSGVGFGGLSLSPKLIVRDNEHNLRKEALCGTRFWIPPGRTGLHTPPEGEVQSTTRLSSLRQTDGSAIQGPHAQDHRQTLNNQESGVQRRQMLRMWTPKGLFQTR
jgi:hypothetical protein